MIRENWISRLASLLALLVDKLFKIFVPQFPYSETDVNTPIGFEKRLNEKIHELCIVPSIIHVSHHYFY